MHLGLLNLLVSCSVVFGFRLGVCFGVIMVVIYGLILWLFGWVLCCLNWLCTWVKWLFIFGVGMLITISVAIVAFMLIVCFGDCLLFNSVVSCLASVIVVCVSLF